MYAKDLSRKVRSAKRQRACKGYYISAQAPFGYKVDPQNRNRLTVDEAPAEVVKEIFRLTIAGNTLSQISRILTEQEIITPSAYKAQNGDTRFYRYHENGQSPFGWCYQTVRAILKDQVYTGDMVNHKFEMDSSELTSDSPHVCTGRRDKWYSDYAMNRLNTIEDMEFKVSWKLIAIGLFGSDKIPIQLTYTDLFDYLDKRLNNHTGLII